MNINNEDLWTILSGKIRQFCEEESVQIGKEKKAVPTGTAFFNLYSYSVSQNIRCL